MTALKDMDFKTLYDHRADDAEEMDLVSSTDTDDHLMIDDVIVNETDIPLPAAASLDESPCSTEMTRQVTRLGFSAGGCQPSKRNGTFADPMSSRMAAVYRDVHRPLPWVTKGPSTSGKTTTRVVHPPPVLPKVRTGVSQAALKYKATDRIKKLAEHRLVPKKDIVDERLCFSVKPHALTYNPSLRIKQLAVPRICSKVKNLSSSKQNFPNLGSSM